MCGCDHPDTGSDPAPPIPPTVSPRDIKQLPLTAAERFALRADGPLVAHIRRRARRVLRRGRPGVPIGWHGCDCERLEALQSGQVPDFVMDAIEADCEPLAPATRRRFERRLGVSLAHVRIAHGRTARLSAERLNVVAYAVGSRIVLGERAIRNDPGETDWILAHEIAHVLQQSTPASDGGRWAARDALEAQADVFADGLVGHGDARFGAILPAAPKTLLMNPLWLRCSSICAGAGGGLEGVFMDFNIFTKAQGICQINDCGTPVTPGLQARGWCVYSCAGGGKKYAVFFINTRCGFVGPHYVF